jgi:FkbM family methyltransferase
VALLDFRDEQAFSMVNFVLGDFGDGANLFRCLEATLRPGDVFWDVGANIGAVSGHFAHPRFKLSCLHAFEPNPEPLKTLQPLFAGNSRCIVHPFGLGDKDQMITLHLSSQSSGVSSMLQDFKGDKDIQVQIRRGDSVRRELRLPIPHVVKIDVEGFEPGVFAGLAETIAEHRPIIAFETWFRKAISSTFSRTTADSTAIFPRAGKAVMRSSCQQRKRGKSGWNQL